MIFPLLNSELFNGAFRARVSVIGIGPSVAETPAFVGSIKGDITIRKTQELSKFLASNMNQSKAAGKKQGFLQLHEHWDVRDWSKQ